VSEREHLAQFEELTLQQTQGSKLCRVVVGPPQLRHHLSKGMLLVALHHTEMVKELAVLRAVVSSTAELVLGCSPDDTSHVEVVGEVATEF
jgi:hypothetical protein